MRYKKLQNKSLHKKNLHKKSNSKVVGTKRINTYIPERLNDKISLDLINPVTKSPVISADFDITVKKHRFSDFINQIDRKKMANYSLFLLIFT